MDLEETREDSQNESKKKNCIDYSMVPSKLSYFFTYVLFGSYMPYLNIFLKSIGLTHSQAGLISGLRYVVSFLCGFAWGALADHTGRRKLIYVLLCIGTISLLFPLPWIAKYVTGDFKFQLIKNSTYLEQTGADYHRDESNGTSTAQGYDAAADKIRKKLLFTMLAALSASAVFELPLKGYLDAIVMKVVRINKRSATFGLQYIFASTGYGMANFLAGFAADNYTLPLLSSYTPIFFVFLPAGIIMIPLGLILLRQVDTGKDLEATKAKNDDSTIIKLVWQTCSKTSNVIYLLTIFIMGLAFAFNYGFIFFMMEEYMNASKSIMGIVVMVICSSELPIYAFEERIIHLFGGNMQCIIIGVFTYSFQFFMISYVENALLVLPIESLCCMSIALFMLASVRQMQLISPKKIHTTMFSLLNGIYIPLGSLIGNIVGGIIYECYGGQILFRVASLICAGWGIFMVVYFYVFNKLCSKNNNSDEQKPVMVDSTKIQLMSL